MEEGERGERQKEKWRWKMMTKGARLSYNRVQSMNTANKIKNTTTLAQPNMTTYYGALWKNGSNHFQSLIFFLRSENVLQSFLNHVLSIATRYGIIRSDNFIA